MSSVVAVRGEAQAALRVFCERGAGLPEALRVGVATVRGRDLCPLVEIEAGAGGGAVGSASQQVGRSRSVGLSKSVSAISRGAQGASGDDGCCCGRNPGLHGQGTERFRRSQGAPGRRGVFVSSLSIIRTGTGGHLLSEDVPRAVRGVRGRACPASL